jgi:hypothetical protein
MNNRIRINGTDYTSYATNLQELEVKYTLNAQDATVTYSLSTEKLSFAGPAAALIRTLFANPFTVLTVQIDLGCCSKTLYYTINIKGIQDCGDDFIEAQLVTSTTESKAYEVMNRTIIIKNRDSEFITWLVNAGKNIRMEYCNEPGATGYILLGLYMIFYPVLKLIQFVAGIFNDMGIADLNRWELSVVGCGRYWTVFTVNDMLTYYTAQAGLGYTSSILNTPPYKNMVVVDGSNGKGIFTDQIVDWHGKNIFNLTVTQFMEILAPVFRADYRIINGVFRFETKRWFADNAVKVADYQQDDVNCICYGVDVGRFKAYGRYEYTFDPSDEAGNDAGRDYNDIVEWNPTGNETLKGEHNVTLNFAPVRFVRDAHRDNFITIYRTNSTLGARRNELVIARDQLGKLKLIVIDPGVKVRTYFSIAKHVSESGGQNRYNDDLKFDKDATFDELYKRFHHEDDPGKGVVGTIDKIEARLDICQLIDKLETNGMNVYVRTAWGKAIPETVSINTGTGVVTFQNCTIWP